MADPDEWDPEKLRRLDRLMGTGQQEAAGDRAWRIARRRRRTRRFAALLVAVVAVAVVVWVATR